MSESLEKIWEASAANPFHPIVGKGTQFFVGFNLLLIAIILSAIFALNRSSLSIPLLGLPASIAFGFGSVFMICAVGVYV